jgi:hypothetical protein
MAKGKQYKGDDYPGRKHTKKVRHEEELAGGAMQSNVNQVVRITNKKDQIIGGGVGVGVGTISDCSSSISESSSWEPDID